MKKLLLNLVAILLCWTLCYSQQPQTSTAPIDPVNAKWVNGTAPGYYPTKGSGLTLNIGVGTCVVAGTEYDYSGGTLTMTNNTTNYVYLDPSSSCNPGSNTSGFTPSLLPVARVVTSGGVITSILERRTLFLRASVSVFSYPGAGIAQSSGSAWLTSFSIGGSGGTIPTTSGLSGSSGTSICDDGGGGIQDSSCPGGGGGAASWTVMSVNSAHTMTATEFNNRTEYVIPTSTSSGFNLTLPSSGSPPSAYANVWVLNYSAYEVDIAPNGQFLNSTTQLAQLYPGHSAFVTFDGTNYTLADMPGSISGPNSASSSQYLGEAIGRLGNQDVSIGYGIAGNNAHLGVGGNDNTMVGYSVGQVMGGYSGNTCVGSQTCNQYYDTERETALGYKACGYADVNSVCIGYGVGDGSGTFIGDHSVFIGTSSMGGPSGSPAHQVWINGLYFGDASKGIVGVIGPTASLVSCGTGATLTAGSNNSLGQFVVGSGSGNSCELDFGAAFSAEPICQVTIFNTVAVIGGGLNVETAAHIIVTATSGLDGAKVNYSCGRASTTALPVP